VRVRVGGRKEEEEKEKEEGVSSGWSTTYVKL